MVRLCKVLVTKSEIGLLKLFDFYLRKHIEGSRTPVDKAVLFAVIACHSFSFATFPKSLT